MNHFRNGHRFVGDAVAQRLSFQELHHKEGPSLIVAQVVDRADARVVQRRGGAGFTLESIQRHRVPGEAARKELDGHNAVQADVSRLINFTHSTCAQEFQNQVRPDLLAGGNRRSRRAPGALRAGRIPETPSPTLHCRAAIPPLGEASRHRRTRGRDTNDALQVLARKRNGTGFRFAAIESLP